MLSGSVHVNILSGEREAHRPKSEVRCMAAVCVPWCANCQWTIIHA
jgi:hypothetical protein